jgi:chromosome segregation ATPase
LHRQTRGYQVNELQLRVSSIEQKVRDLVADRKRMAEELDLSKKVIEELENQIETLNKQLRQQEENTRAGALTTALMTRQEKTDLKEQIAGMVAEIDRCITLLDQ